MLLYVETASTPGYTHPDTAILMIGELSSARRARHGVVAAPAPATPARRRSHIATCVSVDADTSVLPNASRLVMRSSCAHTSNVEGSWVWGVRGGRTRGVLVSVRKGVGSVGSDKVVLVVCGSSWGHPCVCLLFNHAPVCGKPGRTIVGGCVDASMDGCMHGCMDGLMDAWTNRKRMEGIDERADAWMGGVWGGVWGRDKVL
eukprot:354372-Chlamydomonas_euryale.AAC.1